MKKATVLPVGVTRDGVVHGAVQHEDRTVSLGTFRPLVADRPIHDLAGVCEITDRPGTPFLDATFPFAGGDEAATPAPAAAAAPTRPTAASPPAEPDRKGPAKVNSQRYREAWDRIFGAATEPGEA